MIEGKAHDKIQGKFFPWPMRHWQRAQQPDTFLSFILGVLTINALGNEFSHIIMETWPTKVLWYLGKGLGYAHVTPCRSQVKLGEQGGDHLEIPW